MAEPRLVRVRAFAGPRAQLDAELAKGILESAGIPAIVPGRYSGELYPGIDEIHLLVHEEDAAEAAQILEEFLDNPSQTPATED
jgi:Putative prokaryotic signal transducing protein